jgi:hypothetical protein
MRARCLRCRYENLADRVPVILGSRAIKTGQYVNREVGIVKEERWMILLRDVSIWKEWFQQNRDDTITIQISPSRSWSRKANRCTALCWRVKLMKEDSGIVWPLETNGFGLKWHARTVEEQFSIQGSNVAWQHRALPNVMCKRWLSDGMHRRFGDAIIILARKMNISIRLTVRRI